METPNLDRIDPRLCVNGKVKRLHRLLDGIYQDGLREFGLKGSMLSILFVISKMKNVSQREVADKLVLDQSTVSRDIKKFITKGWVDAVRSEKDSRITVLKMTDLGYEFLEEVIPVWEKKHHYVTSILGEFNIQNLDYTIKALRENRSNY